MKKHRLLVLLGTVLAILVAAGPANADPPQIPTPPANCKGGFNAFAYTRAALAACHWPTRARRGSVRGLSQPQLMVVDRGCGSP